MVERLIREYEMVDPDALSDYLLVLAGDVEDAMIEAGATPGKDYKYLDIFKLAVAVYAGQVAGKQLD